MKNLSTSPAGLPDSATPDDATADHPRERNTVESIEQKLRAANRKAWIESTNGWNDFFGRFMTFSKARTS
jgi:hypothetical protein